jgi:hypothetical protein
LESVAVAIPVFVDPIQAGLCIRKMPLDKGWISRRPPRGVQGDQIQRRRISGPEIGGVRDQSEVRQLPIAQLMQDLAWLSVAVIIALRRLICPSACSAPAANSG